MLQKSYQSEDRVTQNRRSLCAPLKEALRRKQKNVLQSLRAAHSSFFSVVKNALDSCCVPRRLCNFRY